MTVVPIRPDVAVDWPDPTRLEPEPRAAREALVLCRAETAECTCPDDCERDHANE